MEVRGDSSCIAELGRLREIHEVHFNIAMFGNPQDTTLIQSVFKSPKDKYLWKWVASEIEHIRRWGMICEHDICNRRRREEGRQVHCSMNGRRSKEASTCMSGKIREFEVKAYNLALEECEGDTGVYRLIRGV